MNGDLSTLVLFHISIVNRALSSLQILLMYYTIIWFHIGSYFHTIECPVECSDKKWTS